LLYVTIDARDELPVATSVRHNHADGTDRVRKRFAFNFRVAHTYLLLAFDGHDKFAWFLAAFHFALFHAWHSRHACHSFRLATALHLFSLRLRWLGFGTAFFHYWDQVHRTDGTFSGVL